VCRKVIENLLLKKMTSNKPQHCVVYECNQGQSFFFKLNYLLLFLVFFFIIIISPSNGLLFKKTKLKKVHFFKIFYWSIVFCLAIVYTGFGGSFLQNLCEWL
jgi:hypothetical protein